MKKIFWYLALVVVVVLVGIQFVPVTRSNPPVTGELQTPVKIRQIFKRSCYDCHSNETHWAWYSYIAPVSWLVAKDVREGRKELNFSTWTQMTKKKQRKKLKEIWEEVEEGKMPLKIYFLTHPKARLSNQDKQLIQAWVNTSTKALQQPNHEKGHDSHKQGHDHSHSPKKSAKSHGLSLNQGQKWKMDQHTRESLLQMEKTFTSADHSKQETLHTLGVALKKQLRQLLSGCKMTGPAHDQLHVFLTHYIPAINGLVEAKDLPTSQNAARKIKHLLQLYKQYFE